MRGNRAVLTTILALILVAAAGLSASASVTTGVEASGGRYIPSESMSGNLFAGGLKLAITPDREKDHVEPKSLGLHRSADPITPTVPLSCTDQVTHPVGLALATHFEVPYEEIMDWHQRGLGFGGIVKAYSIAALLGDDVTVEDLFDLKLMGTGWGRIFKDREVNPGSKDWGLGKVMSGQKQGDGEGSATGSPDSGQGQGQGAVQSNRPDGAGDQDRTPPGQTRGKTPPGQTDGGEGDGVGNGKGGGKR